MRFLYSSHCCFFSLLVVAYSFIVYTLCSMGWEYLFIRTPVVVPTTFVYTAVIGFKYNNVCMLFSTFFSLALSAALLEAQSSTDFMIYRPPNKPTHWGIYFISHSFSTIVCHSFSGKLRVRRIIHKFESIICAWVPWVSKLWPTKCHCTHLVLWVCLWFWEISFRFIRSSLLLLLCFLRLFI